MDEFWLGGIMSKEYEQSHALVGGFRKRDF